MLALTDQQILEKADRVLGIEISELERLRRKLGAEFVRAVRLLLEVNVRGGKILVLGVGKSGNVGQKIAATFASTGCVSIVLDSLNALHGDLGVVQDGDVILALSYSGETDELVKILSVIKRFSVKIIGVTGVADSTLARLSDVALDVEVEQEACPLNLAPTSSTTAMLALGDALAMVLLEARNFDREQFSRFHPAGSIGRALLTPVTDVMRDRERITLAGENEAIFDVLRKMTAKRNGAAVIEDGGQRLLGIFTHGDFVRHFSETADIAARPVGAFMTRNPVCIRDGAMAVEALSILREHNVDEIVVVDDGSRVRGIIDVQDLSRHRLYFPRACLTRTRRPSCGGGFASARSFPMTVSWGQWPGAPEHRRKSSSARAPSAVVFCSVTAGWAESRSESLSISATT
jgi:arabinose-5-phosphate isomerase